MREIAHMLLFKCRGLLKHTTRWRSVNLIKFFASIIVFGGFAFGAYFSARVTTSYLLDSMRIGSFLYHRFLSMLLFVFFLSINVGNLIVAYAAFYRSSEVAYYLTKPVAHTSLFLIKFLDNFFYSSLPFFLVAFSVLLGYGSYFHASWTFYLQTMVFMLLPFMLISGCLAVMMLLLLMRYVVKVGAAKMIGGLVLFYFAVLSVYFSITNPVKLVAQVWQHYPHMDQYFGNLDPPFASFLPNQWIAESLYWTMRGDTSFAFSYTLLLLIACGAIFAMMVIMGRKLFYASWVNSVNVQTSRGSDPPFLRIFSLRNPPRLEMQTSVMIKKELWQFIREPSQWIHITIIVFLILTFIGSIAGINLKQPLPNLQALAYLVILVFNLFLIASIALRFVYPSMSSEGANFWLPLVAPVSRRKLYWVKALIPFVPVVFLGEVLVWFSHRSLVSYPGLSSIASVIMVSGTIAMIGLNMGAGAFFADFQEQNPIRIASSQSATLTFLLSLFYICVVVAVIFLPLSEYFGHYLRDLPFSRHFLEYSLSGIAIISVLLGYGALKLGMTVLKRDYR